MNKKGIGKNLEILDLIDRGYWAFSRTKENYFLNETDLKPLDIINSSIIHDLNNTIFLINSYTRISMAEFSDNSAVRARFEHVSKAVSRAKELTGRLQSLSVQNLKAPEKINIVEIIEETVTLIKATLPDNIKITSHIKAVNPFVFAGTGRIYQLIMNLCINAVRAMEAEGGNLVITLSDLKLNGSMENIQFYMKPGNYLQLIVSDTGCGMEEEMIERIFDPLFTTDKKGRGRGMGLTVVYETVNALGGEIAVISEPGKGTSFYVFFPCLVSYNE